MGWCVGVRLGCFGVAFCCFGVAFICSLVLLPPSGLTHCRGFRLSAGWKSPKWQARWTGRDTLEGEGKE